MIKLGWIYVYRFCVVGNTYTIQGSVDHAKECSKIGKKSTISNQKVFNIATSMSVSKTKINYICERDLSQEEWRIQRI